ncbi:MAG: tetratricopeptide repeat protein [Gammaproteobacteria bacterium]|nr:tetratricopeptide repeat protein [Gammaproteobacteria bacterium]
MSDTDEETLENLRQWWDDNGRFVIGGLVIGVAGLVGWHQWGAWQTRTAEEASRLYTAMSSAAQAGRRNEASELADTLVSEFGRTPYADQAGLVMARLHMDANDPRAAAAVLRELMERTRDAELRTIAALRLARVLHHDGDADGALAALRRVEGEVFVARAEEIRGDVLAMRGDIEAAREAYQRALDSPDLGLIDRGLVRIKRDDLPVSMAGGQP